MPNVKAPTLMLWGVNDNFIPLEWGLNAVRLIPNAELRAYSDCGHWVQFERAELFNQTVLDFLEGTNE
jgi:pimeloyl-ACP methyl ester carboxylesterase